MFSKILTQNATDRMGFLETPWERHTLAFSSFIFEMQINKSEEN